MTPLTENEQNVRVFASVVERAQEYSIPTTTSLAPVAPTTEYKHEAFAEIITRAQEGVPVLSARKYGDSGGRATSTRNKFKVKPNMVDFIVDVKNVARKTLTSAEYAYFDNTYFVQYVPVDVLTPNALDTGIRRKLGDAFYRYELFPFNIYMNHADQDVRKKLEV